MPFRRGYWTPKLSLGMPCLDDAHRSLLEELSLLLAARDEAFGAAFSRFVTHVESDFREEEALMEAMEYSALPTHREQHARMLGFLRQTEQRVGDGDIAAGREIAALMPGWFLLHIETMDGALALECQYIQNA